MIAHPKIPSAILAIMSCDALLVVCGSVWRCPLRNLLRGCCSRYDRFRCVCVGGGGSGGCRHIGEFCRGAFVGV